MTKKCYYKSNSFFFHPIAEIKILDRNVSYSECLEYKCSRFSQTYSTIQVYLELTYNHKSSEDKNR